MQDPEPVQPVPPHCDHFGNVPEAALDVDALTIVVDAKVVGAVVMMLIVLDVAALGEELTTTAPGPATDVVKDPDSI